MKHKKCYVVMLITTLGLTVVQGSALEAEKKSLKSAGSVTIVAETDFKSNSNYPAIGIKGESLEIGVEAGMGTRGAQPQYHVYISENGKEVELEQVVSSKVRRLEQTAGGTWVYTPEHAGIFNIQVRDESGKVKAKRKIYVKPDNEAEYYQLKDIEISNEPLTFNTSLDTKQSNETTIMGYTIGESLFPQHTILEKVVEEDYLEIREGDAFDLGTGNYRVESFVKGNYSEEWQDYKTASYKRDNPVLHTLEKDAEHSVELQMTEHEESYDFELKAQCPMGCELECAFIMTDYRGSRVIRGYKSITSDDERDKANKLKVNKLDWDFTIHSRVKHKEDIDCRQGGDVKIPNAYEVEVSKFIDVAEQEVPISTVLIEPSEVEGYYKDHTGIVTNEAHQVVLDGPANSLYPVREMGLVAGKNKNYITIEVPEKTKDGNTFEYKAWAIDDGHWTLLGDYSTNNQFVYYPLSEAGRYATYPDRTHQLVISVQEKNSAGEILGGREETIILEVY